MTTFKVSKFRTARAANTLRKFQSQPYDSALLEWTEEAVKTFAEFVHLENETNGTTKRAYYAAWRAMIDGVELFAKTFYPDDRKGYWEFYRTTEKNIIDMAKLESYTA